MPNRINKQNKQTEQRFDVQGEIYGLVIWHNRVILREIDEKTLRDGSFFNEKIVKRLETEERQMIAQMSRKSKIYHRAVCKNQQYSDCI